MKSAVKNGLDYVVLKYIFMFYPSILTNHINLIVSCDVSMLNISIDMLSDNFSFARFEMYSIYSDYMIVMIV